MWNINNIYDVVSVNKPKFPILDSPFFGIIEGLEIADRDIHNMFKESEESDVDKIYINGEIVKDRFDLICINTVKDIVVIMANKEEYRIKLKKIKTVHEIY